MISATRKRGLTRPKTIVHSVGSASWISPTLWSFSLFRNLFSKGIVEVDHGDGPGAKTVRDVLLGSADCYRFVNFLEAAITVGHINNIIDFKFSGFSGIREAPTTFPGMPAIQILGERRYAQQIQGGIRFTQTVGARTRSPKAIGEFAGTVGCRVGEKFGGWSAEQVIAFPPIWSEIELKIFANGKSEGKVLRHSLFPSLGFYVQETDSSLAYRRVYFHRGTPDRLREWRRDGWGVGNPFDVQRPGDIIERVIEFPEWIGDQWYDAIHQ